MYDESNFLDQSDIEDPSELLYTKIYPYYRVPDANETASSFILLSFRNYKPVKNSYKSGYINIYTITHKDLVPTSYGFLRYDFMMSEIDKLMNSERGIGIGKTQFTGMDEVAISNDHYIGNMITYKIWEFN